MTQLRGEATSAWLEERLSALQQQAEASERELAHLRATVEEQRHAADELHDALGLVEGRTRRHEAGQDLLQSFQQQLNALSERLEDEASLRRDRGGALERERQIEREQLDTASAALTSVAMRLDQLEERVHGELELRRRAASQPAAVDAAPDDGGETEARLVGIERRLTALAESMHRDRDGFARVESALPGLAAAVDALQVRTLAAAEEQRRAGEDVSALRSERSREDELLEVVEQQRSSRHRLDQRLSELEERLESVVQELAATNAEGLKLRQLVMGSEERMRSLGELLEGQRWATIEHYRQLLQAEDEHGRKQIEEIERRLRSNRELLVRLSERSEQVSQEQPL